VTSQSLSEALAHRVANHTASPETSATPASPETSATPASPEKRAAPAEAVQVSPQVDVALHRLVDDVLSPVGEGASIEAEKTEAKTTLGKARSSAREPERERLRTKASELFRASGRPTAVHRPLRRRRSPGELGNHTDVAWILAGTAVAIVLGYLIGHL
jgi:hypothetical protein